MASFSSAGRYRSISYAWSSCEKLGHGDSDYLHSEIPPQTPILFLGEGRFVVAKFWVKNSLVGRAELMANL